MSYKTSFKGTIQSMSLRRGVNFVTICLAARRPLTSIPGIRPRMFHHMSVRFSTFHLPVRRLSTAHTLSYKCELCDRSFGSQKALSQHLRYSFAHFQVPKTPLNLFFQSSDGFKFDPNLPLSESYSSLQRFCVWNKGDNDSVQAWDQYSSSQNQFDPSILLVSFPDHYHETRYSIHSYSLYHPCSHGIVLLCNITDLAVCYQ